MKAENKYTFQDLEFTQKEFTTKFYRDSRILIKLFKTHLDNELKGSTEELFKHTNEILNVLGTESFEDFKDQLADPKYIKKISKLIKKEVDQNPNFIKVILAMENYKKEIPEAKINFLYLHSIIPDEYGNKKAIMNIKLILDTFLQGETEKINYDVKDDQVFELEDFGVKILNDFFLSIMKSKLSLSVPPEIMMNLKF
jgi:hypothetical protein